MSDDAYEPFLAFEKLVTALEAAGVLPPDAGAHDQPRSLVLIGCPVCNTFSTPEDVMAGRCCEEPAREDCPRRLPSTKTAYRTEA